jgi:fatty-acyl-CoA synthase
MPHEKWGETPCAYIELANGASATVDELRDWCKQELAGFKVPNKFVFAPIPKTSTGKVQKFALREQVLKLED